MNAEAEIPEEDGEGDGTEEGEKKKKIKLSLPMIIGGGVGLIVVGLVVAFFLGVFDEMLGIQKENLTASLELGEPVTHELPQIKADLKTGACRSPFLRITIAIHIADPDLDRLEDSQDRVMEQILLHLRDQERQDLVGKTGADTLRFDLVNIINNVIKPARIQGIIFREFILQ